MSLPSLASLASLGDRLRRHELLLLAALALALFLPGLASRDLWNPDEPRYAEVAREMVASGQYFVPQLNGRLYSEKPPLQFWSMAFASLFTGGLDERSARLPAVASVTAATLLLFATGRRLFDREVAWLAALAFLTCSKILWQGRVGQIDMLLTALVMLAMYFWTRGWLERRPGFYALFFFVTGVATVAKGPVGLLPPLLSIIAFLVWTRQTPRLREMRIGRGLVLWALPVLAWIGPATAVAGTEYLRTMVLRQSVQRFADPWHHFQPWYYYLGVVAGDFLPWSLLLPGAVVAGLATLRGERRDAFRLALCWVVGTVVFFSLSPGKRSVYVLTMYPGLALLVGAGLVELARGWPQRRAWVLAPLTLLAALPFVGAVALPFVVSRQGAELAPLGADLPWRLAAIAVGVGALATWALLAARTGRLHLAAERLALAFAAGALVAVLTVLPRFDAVKSARGLSAEILARVAPDEPYAIWPRFDAPFVFYTRRFAVELRDEADLVAFTHRPGRVWLLAERGALAKLAPPLALFEVAHDAEIGPGGYLLLTNRPEARRSAHEEPVK